MSALSSAGREWEVLDRPRGQPVTYATGRLFSAVGRARATEGEHASASTASYGVSVSRTRAFFSALSARVCLVSAAALALRTMDVF